MLIKLEDWALSLYGTHTPHIGTLRRWARESRIQPPPVKTGRTYFVEPDARYVEKGCTGRSVVVPSANDGIVVPRKPAQKVSASDLVSRILSTRNGTSSSR